jgi:hypothetical protein
MHSALKCILYLGQHYQTEATKRRVCLTVLGPSGGNEVMQVTLDHVSLAPSCCRLGSASGTDDAALAGKSALFCQITRAWG